MKTDEKASVTDKPQEFVEALSAPKIDLQLFAEFRYTSHPHLARSLAFSRSKVLFKTSDSGSYANALAQDQSIDQIFIRDYWNHAYPDPVILEPGNS